MIRDEVNRIEIGRIKNLDSRAKVITIEGKEGHEKNRIICLCSVKEFDNAVRFRFFVGLIYFLIKKL